MCYSFGFIKRTGFRPPFLYIYIYTYTYRSSTRLRGRLVDGQICASQSSGDSLAQVLVKLQIPSWPQGLSIFDLPGGKRQVEERGS